MEKFSFIPNHLNVELELPYQLAAGCVVKKATDQQIQVIETNLQSMGSLIHWTRELPYKVTYSFEEISKEDMIVEEISEEDTVTYVSSLPLERSKWKYYILTYEDEGRSLLNLQFASNLGDVVLTLDAFICDIYKGQYVFGCTPEIAFRFFSENDLYSQLTLRGENLEQIRRVNERMIYIQEDFAEIMNTIKLFNSLRYLPQYNDFKILGLFSVIESLLTHKPKSTETGDSLTRQVKTKVPLLLRRTSSSEIKYSEFFGGYDESKIWKTLYEYRSCLAHGTTPDFNKELALLKNPKIVYDFLITCIKNLLVQALFEPQLVMDLKKC